MFNKKVPGPVTFFSRISNSVSVGDEEISMALIYISPLANIVVCKISLAGKGPKPFGTQFTPFTFAPKVLAPVCVAGGSSATSFLQEINEKAAKQTVSIFFIDLNSGGKTFLEVVLVS